MLANGDGLSHMTYQDWLSSLNQRNILLQNWISSSPAQKMIPTTSFPTLTTGRTTMCHWSGLSAHCRAGNEPDLLTVYLFNYVGRPDLTQKVSGLHHPSITGITSCSIHAGWYNTSIPLHLQECQEMMTMVVLV